MKVDPIIRAISSSLETEKNYLVPNPEDMAGQRAIRAHIIKFHHNKNTRLSRCIVLVEEAILLGEMRKLFLHIIIQLIQ